MKAKGKQLGDEWVHSTAFVSLADKVNAASRRGAKAMQPPNFHSQIR